MHESTALDNMKKLFFLWWSVWSGRGGQLTPESGGQFKLELVVTLLRFQVVSLTVLRQIWGKIVNTLMLISISISTI